MIIGRSREVFEGSIGEPIKTSCLVGDIPEDGLEHLCCYFEQRGGFRCIQQGLADRGGTFYLSPNCVLLAPGRSSPGRFWKGRSRTLSLFLREL